MEHSLVVLVGEQIPESARHLQASLPQLHFLERNRLLSLSSEPKPTPNPFPSLPQLCRSRGLVLVTPAPMLETTSRHRKSAASSPPAGGDDIEDSPGRESPISETGPAGRRPTSARLSSGAQMQRPRSKAVCRAPRLSSPSPPESPGRACR